MQERELLKIAEAGLQELRDDRSAENIGPMVEREVARALHESSAASSTAAAASAAAHASLEQKVEECGRLIVRMGAELMEESKRRQALEAELQELRASVSSDGAPAVETPDAEASINEAIPKTVGELNAFAEFLRDKFGGQGGA